MLVIFIKIIFLLLFIRQIIIVLLAIWTYKTGDAPFKSTETSVIKQLISEYKISENHLIYDLGSGSGQAVFQLAKYLPNKFIGLEKNLFLNLIANFRKLLRFDKKRFNFIRSDIFDFNFKKSRIIYLYMSDKANTKLTAKFERELPKEAIIIALRFKFESKNFKLVKLIEAKYPLYIYKKVT